VLINIHNTTQNFKAPYPSAGSEESVPAHLRELSRALGSPPPDARMMIHRCTPIVLHFLSHVFHGNGTKAHLPSTFFPIPSL